jgi:hypothetical protein
MCKVESKVSLGFFLFFFFSLTERHAMKAWWGSGGIDTRFDVMCA